jgi:hypothetical protein
MNDGCGGPGGGQFAWVTVLWDGSVYTGWTRGVPHARGRPVLRRFHLSFNPQPTASVHLSPAGRCRSSAHWSTA